MSGDKSHVRMVANVRFSVRYYLIQSNFGFNIFRGFRSTGGQNFRFPIDFAGHR